jgi:hypothetical protein
VLASSAVDRGFESRSNQTNECNIIICCSFHRHATLRNKSKHYLAQDQHNVSTDNTMAKRKRNKGTNNDLQNIMNTHKTKDRGTRTKEHGLNSGVLEMHGKRNIKE